MKSLYETPAELKQPDVTANLLNNEIIINKGPKFGKRHLQVMMLSLLLFCSFLVRTSLSVTIVAMTDPSANINKDIPTYDWNDKSLVVGSFLWGYCLPQMLAGYLATRYGGKWFLVGGTTITTLLGLLIPITADIFGSKGVMVCRFFQGFSQGFLYPSIHSVLGKWLPSHERSLLGTAVYSGSPAGIVASMLLSGYISASHYGWPMVFYLLDGVTLIVCFVYAYVGSSNPSCHSTITPEEKLYITTNLKTSGDKIKLRVPWKHIFKSMPFYALMITNIAFNYTHWSMITETAIYMNKVMNFDLKSNGVLTCLPYLIELFVGIATSFIADYLLVKKLVSTTAIRKTANNIGLIISAVSLFLLTKTGPDSATFAVILVVLTSAFQGTSKSGHIVNHMDLAPNYSGILMGFTNGSAVIISAFSPIFTYLVVRDETNVNQWNIIFYFSMTVNIIACIINSVFTSGNREHWNEPKAISNTVIEDKIQVNM